MQNIDSRIKTYKRFQHSYIDSNNTEHIISYVRGFVYIKYGLFLRGDEGRGFYLKIKGEVGDFKTSNDKIVNVFYLENGKWVKIENQ